MHQYLVRRLFHAMKEDLSQIALVRVGIWCIGEYGEVRSFFFFFLLLSSILNPFFFLFFSFLSFLFFQHLIAIPTATSEEPNPSRHSEKEVLDILETIRVSHHSTLITRQYLLNTLIKLSVRFTESVGRIERVKMAQLA